MVGLYSQVAQKVVTQIHKWGEETACQGQLIGTINRKSGGKGRKEALLRTRIVLSGG